MADKVSLLDLHSRHVIALRDLHAKPFRVTVGPQANRMKRDPLAGRRYVHRRKAGDPGAEDGHPLPGSG
jgi:hypothetical protein